LFLRLDEAMRGLSVRGLRSIVISLVLCASLVACRDEVNVAASQTDDLGRAVNVPARIERVITLSPNLTEMLFAIGVGDRIIGADDFSNYPAGAQAIPKVGGLQPNLEKIVQLEPDLVLASTEGNHPNLAKALASAGIPLYVVRTDRLAHIAPAMQRLGALLAAPKVDEAVRALESGIAREKRTRKQRRRVLFAVWTDPLYVAGRNTFVHDLYELTGCENVVTLDGWPQYSLETFVQSPPEVLLYPKGAVTREQVDALLARAPSLNVRVVAVDEDIFQRPGPRVVDAAKALNSLIDHP
jgi:iron complex transport system substrate-binding protein